MTSKVINMKWSTVEDGHTIVKSENKYADGTQRQVKETRTIVSLKDNIRIITKYNNPYLDNINHFLKKALFYKYYSIKLSGLSFIQANTLHIVIDIQNNLT